MPHLDKDTFETWQLAADALRMHGATIQQALRKRIEEMTARAEELEAEVKAAQADPEVAAKYNQENYPLFTLRGVNHVAELARQQAEQTGRALDAVNKALDEEDE